jgi:hypothetical protein
MVLFQETLEGSLCQRIHSPCSNTCGECTIEHTTFQYKELREKNTGEEYYSDADNASAINSNTEEEAAVKALSHLFKDDIIVDDLSNSFLTAYCIDQERILEAAGNHVVQENGVRHYVQEATEADIMCLSFEVLHKDRECVIVCDYAHNMPLPHYGDEGPGDIYYFSPLILNLFGIIDLSPSPTKLSCYAYHNFMTKKRRNNVASLLM